MAALTVLAVAGYLVFWTLVLSFAARRFLELRAGPVRLFLSGAAGVAVAGFAVGEQMQSDERGLGFAILFIGIGLLSAMGLLIVGELIVPAGSGLRFVSWYRAGRRWRQRTWRYSQISRTAVRHGLAAYLSGRRDPSRQPRAELARRLRLALDEAGVVFVKFGQVMSTRRDLLPPEFVDELSQLQNQVAPVGWEQVERLLAEELGRPVPEVFTELDPIPLAAGSIAQVHRARLRTGEQVVVKLRRPGIAATVDRDLDITWRMASMLAQRAEWARSIGIRELAAGFAEALREELDFTIEARNMASVAAARSDGTVAIAQARHELSSSRVLVMDYLDGLPLDQAAPIIDERGLDRAALATTLLHTLLTQILFDGVFLADPHPGNLMLLRDGRLGLLDFGSVGRIDATLRAVLQRLLLAIDTGDPTAVSDALIEVVDRREEIDETGLERAVGRFMTRYLGPGLPVDMEMFAEMLRLVTRYGVSVPPELAAVFRALATAEGTLTQLAPDFDIVAQARAFATSRLHHAVLPRSLRTTVTAEVVKLLPLVRRLPRRLDRITSALEHGRLSTGVRPFADDRDRRVVTALVHQTLFTILAAATGIVAAILLGIEGGPQVARSLTLYHLLSYILLIASGALTLRVLTSILRSR